MPYDLFLGVPKHRAPDVVIASGLAEDGYVTVDSRTLETRFPGVYAVGDVATVGVPKAGVFAEGQARVVAEELIAEIRSDGDADGYAGQGSCYIEFGGGRVGRVDVDFLGGPKPTGTYHAPSVELVAEKERLRLQPRAPAGSAARPLLGRLGQRPALGAAGRLHEVLRADQREAGDGADEGDDRRDQDDLVEAADEGRVGSVEQLRRRPVARSASSTAREPPEATSSPRPLGACGSCSEIFESIRDWKTAPSAATPVAIPTWRKVVLIPEPIPDFSHRDDGDRRLADPRVGGADADPGDDEAGQQRRPARVDRDAAHQQQADADQDEPEPEQEPDRDFVRERARDRRDDEAEDGQRQEAQAGLQRREVEHALHVDRQVEEHREHPRREAEGDRGDAVEGVFAEKAQVEHRVAAAQLDRDEGAHQHDRADQAGDDLGAAPALRVAADQAEDQQEEGSWRR